MIAQVSDDPKKQRMNTMYDGKYVHIDENNAERPYICGTGFVYRGHVVSAFCEGR